jgi:hypothetical protein
MLKKILLLNVCLMPMLTLSPAQAKGPKCNATEIMASCNTHCKLSFLEPCLKESNVDMCCENCVRASQLSARDTAGAARAIKECKTYWKGKGYK